MQNLGDKALILVMIVISVAILVTVIGLMVKDNKPDPNLIYSSRDQEVRAVCTAGSGLIVTTQFNSRIAGDSVSTERMTEQEYALYCHSDGE